MSDRLDLITRKHEVRVRIEQARRQVEQERSKGKLANPRKLAQLESRLDELMAEEFNLRIAIDQRR